MNISDVQLRMVKDLAHLGYCLIENTTDADLWTCATGLGIPRYESKDGQVIKLIRPRAEGLSPPNTLSSRHGIGSFPFHTDAAYWYKPPRFLLLRCLDPGEGDRCTLLTDSQAWWSEHQWDMLTAAICTVAGSRPFLAPLAASTPDGGAMIRYDVACMKPTNRHCLEALDFVDVKITNAQVTEIHWRPGTLLVVDNYRLLHARGESQIQDPNRVHQKMLVEEIRNDLLGSAQRLESGPVLA